MANVVEEGGAPSSNIVGGAPTATKTFTMPASVALDVQTVVATIDNSAGASPVTATITIADQAGQVIDANAQDDTIPAGGTGTATFARRLVDNHGGIRFGKGNTGTWLVVHTSGTAPVPPASSGGAGIELVATGAGVYAEGTFVFFTSSGDTEIDAGDDFIVNVIDAEQHTVGGNVEFNAANFFVDTVTADIAMNAVGDVTLAADGQTYIQGSPMFLFATDEIRATTFATGVFSVVDGQGFGFRMQIPNTATSPVYFKLKTNQRFQIVDHNDNPLFRVDENGDLHGKTGKALVFDL